MLRLQGHVHSFLEPNAFRALRAANCYGSSLEDRLAVLLSHLQEYVTFLTELKFNYLRQVLGPDADPEIWAAFESSISPIRLLPV